MERSVLVLFVLALFLSFAVLGWAYHRAVPSTPGTCTTAEAQCGDRPDAGPP
jgi:hypothetical protein